MSEPALSADKPQLSRDSAREYRKAVAEEIAAENTLITNRMTWNLTFQGFLFTGYALALGRLPLDPPAGMRCPGLSDRASIFLDMLPFAGISVAAIALIGVWVAFRQISYLQECWTSYGRDSTDRIDAVGDSVGKADLQLETWGPRPFSTPWRDRTGRLPPLLISATLIGAWGWLLPWHKLL